MNTAGPEISGSVATVVDGFIVGENGEPDWLDEANATVPAGENSGFCQFMETVDVLVMGRQRYENVQSLGECPYGNTRAVILSSRAIEFPARIPVDLTHSAESPRSLHQRLSRDGAKHLYVDGAITIQQFLDLGLINEITVTVVPVILRSGTSLFGSLEHAVLPTHCRTRSCEFVLVQVTYEIVGGINNTD